MSEFYKGKILISNSSIITDDFNKSVVFMMDHDSTGAFGLVINKKSLIYISELVTQLPKTIHDSEVYWGGPVDMSFVSILHNKSNLKEPGIEIIKGVFLSRSYEVLLDLLTSSDNKYHIFQGYSGWGAGQLESEFLRKSWVSHEASSDIIFSQNPETVWREALRSKGGIYKYFAEHTKDPLLN